MRGPRPRRPRARRRRAGRSPASRRRAGRRRPPRRTPGARGPRLAHAALEDPRAHRAGPTSAYQETFVRPGNCGSCSIAGPIAAGRAPRARPRATWIAFCGLPIACRTCWTAKPPDVPSWRRTARAQSIRHVVAERIVGRISPAAVWTENWRRVGPPGPAQVQDRLARAVAGELGLGAVGVEDPQPGDEAGASGGRELEDAVRADARVAVAEAPHDGGASGTGRAPRSTTR